MVLFFFLKILFIHERHRERERQRQREKQAPCREPDVGLDPGTTGSCPELKADAQPLSHPGIPILKILFIHERHREKGRDAGRGRSRLHAGSLTWDSIPGLQDHTLG